MSLFSLKKHSLFSLPSILSCLLMKFPVLLLDQVFLYSFPSLPGFVQLLATYTGLSNPTAPACSLSHHPPGFKDQLLSMYEGLFCLTVSRNPHWSYSRSDSNVITPWHQGECAAHAEVSHQQEAQHQLFNRHLNLVLCSSSIAGSLSTMTLKEVQIFISTSSWGLQLLIWQVLRAAAFGGHMPTQISFSDSSSACRSLEQNYKIKTQAIF